MSSRLRLRLTSAVIIAAVNFVWVGFAMFIVLSLILGPLALLAGDSFPWSVIWGILPALAGFGAFAGFMEDMWPGTIRR